MKKRPVLKFILVSIVACTAATAQGAGLLGTAMTLAEAGKQVHDGMQAARSGQTTKGASTGFQNCPQFFAGGYTPTIKKAAVPLGTLRELCFDAFAVLHSGALKTPVFAFERLTAQQLADAADEERTNRFFADARLPSAERAQLEDYQGSNHDRGHLAPGADMPTAQAMAQSFSLANMIPQAPVNNRKTWRNVESSVRKYVKRAKGAVYVITGPYGVKATVGSGRVAVPEYLYKLVYDETENRAWAYLVRNTDDARIEKPITYAELVALTGIEFLPGIKPSH